MRTNRQDAKSAKMRQEPFFLPGSWEIDTDQPIKVGEVIPYVCDADAGDRAGSTEGLARRSSAGGAVLGSMPEGGGLDAALAPDGARGEAGWRSGRQPITRSERRALLAPGGVEP